MTFKQKSSLRHNSGDQNTRERSTGFIKWRAITGVCLLVCSLLLLTAPATSVAPPTVIILGGVAVGILEMFYHAE